MTVANASTFSQHSLCMFLSQFLYKMDKSVKRKIFPVESQRRKKCCVDFHYTCSNDFCNASTQAVNGDIDPQLSQLGAEDTFTAQTISTNIQNAVQVIELPRLISKDVRVEGTEFLVDHFVVRKDVKHYFLTRFDRSHGLTAEFNQTLYASIETGNIVISTKVFGSSFIFCSSCFNSFTSPQVPEGRLEIHSNSGPRTDN